MTPSEFMPPFYRTRRVTHAEWELQILDRAPGAVAAMMETKVRALPICLEGDLTRQLRGFDAFAAAAAECSYVSRYAQDRHGSSLRWRTDEVQNLEWWIGCRLSPPKLATFSLFIHAFAPFSLMVCTSLRAARAACTLYPD